MIRNVFLKNLLTSTVFETLSLLNKTIKKNDNIILLYSDLGFRDNIKYLYDHLIRNKFNDKYKIVCAVKNYESFKQNAPKNVVFTSPIKGIATYVTCKHVFYCFGKLPIVPTNKQKVIQMWHGTSFKGFSENMKKTAKTSDFYTYVYASSEYFKPIVMKKFNCNENKVVICGHPRTDIMYKKNVVPKMMVNKKNIIWMPTFRSSKLLGQQDTKQENVLPILNNDQFIELDNFLQQNNVNLIVKLHPMQDTSEIDLKKFINLKLLTNAEFEKQNLDLYEMLSQTDGLITDYSSVFYDYLLLNKPIGFTEDDVLEYKKNRGFAVDPDKFRPGQKIRTINDLKKFIENVSRNNDEFVDERREINNLSNYYKDGKNCVRTLQLSNIFI